MERIKSVSTNYIFEKDLYNTQKVAKIFENGKLDFLYVIDNRENIIGVYSLEDFCNSREIMIERIIPQVQEVVSEEEKLLQRIMQLTNEEIYYVQSEIFNSFGENFVCCCNSRDIAVEILHAIFHRSISTFKIVESVCELEKGDRVLFLSFKAIKIYRKIHFEEIDSMIVLNNLVQDSINRTTFYRKYLEIMEYFKKTQVGFFYGVIPEKDMLNCLSKRALDRIAGFGRTDYEFHEELLGGVTSGDYIACMDQFRLSHVIDNGIFKSLGDCKSEFYNVVSGMRVTTSQPEHYENKIYIFGPCTARGAMVEDRNTIASILQRFINRNQLPYIVLNCGVGGGSNLENTFRYMVSMPICPGDIVVLIEEGQFLDKKISDTENIFFLAEGFNEVKLETEWFLDRPAHCNAKANEVIANQIMNKIFEHEKLRKLQSDSDIVQLFKGTKKIFNDFEPLKEYVKNLEREKFFTNEGDVIGSITMHCNPITKGHKYLIERALEEVDYLYIFILSEDKSDIPFALRKKLLLYEVRDYNNVKVLDCGEFMASIATFPEYFSKEVCKESKVDASKDILIFCQYVAPALDITKRFVGTEKRDFVTRQYNSQLKIILPMYRIELFEINRIENADGECISAYSTREYIKNGDWNSVSKMVSSNTLLELRNYFEGEK